LRTEFSVSRIQTIAELGVTSPTFTPVAWRVSAPWKPGGAASSRITIELEAKFMIILS
jgi:hypothetical protein